MKTVSVIVLIVLVITIIPKLFLILMLLPISVWSKKHYIEYKKCLNIDKEIKETNFSEPTRRINYYKQLCSAFFNGFLRYVDIKTGYIPSFLIRNFLYKSVFRVRMGNNVTIHYGAEIRSHYKLAIGEGTIIGDRNLLDARNGLIIGKNVNFSSDVRDYTEQHDHRDPFFRCDTQPKNGTRIDDYVWVGSNVIILPNVHIGEGAVCCAGCVVTKDVAPYSVVAGIPAQKVGERPKGLKYQFKQDGFFY